MLLFLATRNPKRWRFYSLVTRLLRDRNQYGRQCAIPRSNHRDYKRIEAASGDESRNKLNKANGGQI